MQFTFTVTLSRGYIPDICRNVWFCKKIKNINDVNKNMTAIDRMGGQTQNPNLSRDLCHFFGISEAFQFSKRMANT